MNKIIKAAVLLLSLSILASSCKKDNTSSGSLSGTWAINSKVAIYDNPTEAQKFVENLGYLVFSGNTVTFKDWDNKEVIGKGTFTYSVTETIEHPEGTEYRGKITFSGVPLKGGDISRKVLKSFDSIDWHDTDDIYIGIRNTN